MIFNRTAYIGGPLEGRSGWCGGASAGFKKIGAIRSNSDMKKSRSIRNMVKLGGFPVSM